MPNCPELIFSYLACFKLGAIAVPLNHRYRQLEAEYALAHSGSTTLVVHADKRADVHGLPFARLGIDNLFLIDQEPQPDSGFRPFATLLTGDAPALPAATFDDWQLATIMYTSGTTAKPKGVVHSHETLWNCV
jgi:acyl-CoA synthetase (AMP-forming)/AMP-acid ligase II